MATNKPYDKCSKLEKTARTYDGRRRACCRKCKYGTKFGPDCPKDIFEVCTNAFVEGFIKGFKHHKLCATQK